MEDKLTNIKERILYISDYKGISKEKFFKEIGMTYGNFKGKSKLTPINSNALADILAIHSDISPIWLITGEGEMLINKYKLKVKEGIAPYNDKSIEDIIESLLNHDITKAEAVRLLKARIS